MSTNTKNSSNLITAYLEKSKKRDNRVLSPVEQEHQSKKPNKRKIYEKENMELATNKSRIDSTNAKTEIDNFKELLVPLLEKVDDLKQSVENKYSKLEEAITIQKSVVSSELHKLENTITSQREELRTTFTHQINKNDMKVQQVLNENLELKQENKDLKERLDKLESLQLLNNVIITGIPEQQWESYTLTKQRVHDTILASKGINHDQERNEERETEITYCTRIGKYRQNISRPISVTFQKREDKEQLLMNRRNLPPGIYVNEEYPIQIKRARDRLRPVYWMIKSKPKYKDKCKLQGDKLVVDGIKYTVDTLGSLPMELSAYQAAEKRNDEVLVFHGEWSPFSNFHISPFSVDGIAFRSAEHYIQYQKSLYFGDSITANQILKSQTPIEAKRLSYNITNFNIKHWLKDGYALCEKGVKEKFTQNTALMDMLKNTGSLTIAEASKDRTWGTGIPLRDTEALLISKWKNRGWLSNMLMSIWEQAMNGK